MVHIIDSKYTLSIQIFLYFLKECSGILFIDEVCVSVSKMTPTPCVFQIRTSTTL